jgi:hypothetical protein
MFYKIEIDISIDRCEKRDRGPQKSSATGNQKSGNTKKAHELLVDH